MSKTKVPVEVYYGMTEVPEDDGCEPVIKSSYLTQWQKFSDWMDRLLDRVTEYVGT